MIWLVLIFLVAELIYFRIADRFSIVDKPNKRSSHNYITRRGGGVIFPLAWMMFSAYNGFMLPWFTAGLILISVVSFMDDISEVGVVTRLLVHSLALILAFYDFGLINMLPVWGVVCCFVVAMAMLNAINFMDGINGITGLYALCFWIPIAVFVSLPVAEDALLLSSPLSFIIASLLIFGFFNFRNYAVCFAGDVGSVSMAYLIIGALTLLIFKTDIGSFTGVSQLKTGYHPFSFEPKYLLLLSVYGVDSFFTIVHRLILKENIFRGHRTHLYQYLVNEFRLPHLTVATIYAALQLGINTYVLNYKISITEAFALLLTLSLLYIGVKMYILKLISGNETVGTGVSKQAGFSESKTHGANKSA